MQECLRAFQNSESQCLSLSFLPATPPFSCLCFSLGIFLFSPCMPCSSAFPATQTMWSHVAHHEFHMSPVQETNPSWDWYRLFPSLYPWERNSDWLSLNLLPVPEVKASDTDSTSGDQFGGSEFGQIIAAILGIQNWKQGIYRCWKVGEVKVRKDPFYIRSGKSNPGDCHQYLSLLPQRPCECVVRRELTSTWLTDKLAVFLNLE